MRLGMFHIVMVIACVAMSGAGCGGGPEPAYREAVLFTSGTEGYHTFRIPSLLTTPGGTVIAFCEGRKSSRSDTGDIDIVMRRSTDGGETWTPMTVIWDDGENVCGNPCPVIDRETGTIHLLLTHNRGIDSEKEIMDSESEETRTVWVMRSDDDGLTWSRPADITADTKRPDWTWYATGPGVGIQLTTGRLVVPCDFALAGTKDRGSHVIISDDSGASWRIGGTILPKCNECQAVELTDGRLLINMRSYHGFHRRAVATSRDGGETWSSVTWDRTLVEPVCQASLLRYSGIGVGERGRVLFSNPADSTRVRMTVRLSYDDCASWPVDRTLWEGPSAYSCLTVLPGGSIGCLFEKGEETAYETITFAAFNLPWLTGGRNTGD